MFSKIRQQIKDQFTVCPRTGKINGIKIGKRKAFWLWFVVGIASVIWVLVRVVPKPSRADYPCQKVAQPIAAGFIAWLLGLAGSALIIRKARNLFQRKRYVIGAISFAIGAILCFVTLNVTHDVAASVIDVVNTEAFVPTDPANSPVGVAKGIFPGRVVWVYDSEICDAKIKNWWDDTDPEVARRMITQAMYNLTGIADQVKAWDALFKDFNQTRYGQNDVGYQAGDKIAIKVNNIFSRSYKWSGNQLRSTPQMVYALIWHLVNNAGVPEEDITFYDCIFYHGDPVYNYNHAAFPGVRWAEGDATDRKGYEGGPGNNQGTRELVERDPNCVVYYGDPDLVKGSGEVCFPTVVSEAKYLMSYSLPRPHPDLAGVTCCAKNYFGAVWHPTIYDYYHHWQPMFMHEAVAAHDLGDIKMRPMGSYNALVDLMGHQELGGKNILLIGECIHQDYWSAAPFNGKYASSLFVSQDFVAIESVLIDFLRSSDYGLKDGNIDNYLHEAAQADNPPSGTVYDPENDGVPLKSLGVHEHWNNSTDKQYSRNLGTGEGIELIQVIDNPEIPTSAENFSNNFEGTSTLLDNYPNPFNVSTKIRYTVPKPADISISIYNMKGEIVRTLVNQYQPAGEYETHWDGNNYSHIRLVPGIYICRMEINTGFETISQSHKLMLVE
ncbi:MAG: DUF362 domain-containing protein [Prolixibacteraceae bacterium]|nr:DUF362 domain-containing protein [Prolixibacteraceae bacterium]